MYKIYIKQAWALIRQERFFSSVYIVGTGLAISMVMALAVAYHIRTANIAPEVHRDRMCYLSNVTYKLNGTKSNYKAACGPRLVKEVIGNLRVPEDVAVTTNSFMMPFSYGDAFMRLPGGDESPKVRLKGCDDGFWRVYRFDFVEGRPFTEAEFLSGMPRAVLCRSLAVRPSNSPSFVTYEEGGDEAARDVERIVERLRGHADVEAVALSVSSLPYTLSWSGSRVTRDSVSVSVRLMTVSPDYFRVFGIRPASGESPERLGEALSGTREGRDRVISAELARRLYGTTDAIGADIYLHGDTLPGHVVAVTGPVRNDEFDRRKQCILFSLLDLRELNDLTQVQITFRLRPSVATAGYADRFLKAMKRQLMVGNFWVSEVRAYPDVRSSYLENSIESNAQRIVSALGLFLLTNVFLAVIGTFWFHVSRRRAELGLRMAMGSTRASILGLVMGEGLMLLTIATVPALLIYVNLAWIDLMPPGLVESKVGCFLINSLLTWLILALIISLATWYPARKASSLEPADALRYDG